MAKSIANQLSPSQILGRAATLLRLLEEEGLPYEAWQIPIDDPAKRQRLVRYWQAGMPRLVKAQLSDLRRLDPVYDACEVSELLSLGYTDEQITAFGPPPDALPGFLTFFDPGWDLLRLRKFCADKGQIFLREDWYDREAFAEFREEPRYRQMRLEAVEGSFNKDFNSQRCLLPDTDDILLVRAVVMGMVVHFLLSGQRLFERYYVRSGDKDSVDYRVYVGGFDSDGFDIYYGGDVRRDRLDLASSRKS